MSTDASEFMNYLSVNMSIQMKAVWAYFGTLIDCKEGLRKDMKVLDFL